MFNVGKTISLYAAILATALLLQCDYKGPSGPEGPKLKGTMTGFAMLVKANGSLPARFVPTVQRSMCR